MVKLKIHKTVSMIFLCILLLTGCQTQASQNNSADSAASGSPVTAAPTASSEPSAQQTQKPAESDAPKDANWVIEIDDTQQITDEIGIIWNYTLTFYASNHGGKDVLGDYSGEAVLKIEPDLASVQAAAAREGSQLLAMLFKYHAEAEDVSFEVFEFSQDKYAELMKENMPDNPLMQFNPGDAIDFFSVSSTTFDATQEPIDMTIADDDGTFSGTVPGRSTSVNVPFEISFDGATAYCFFYDTPHPLARAFKGVVTGDVI